MIIHTFKPEVVEQMVITAIKKYNVKNQKLEETEKEFQEIDQSVKKFCDNHNQEVVDFMSRHKASEIRKWFGLVHGGYKIPLSDCPRFVHEMLPDGYEYFYRGYHSIYMGQHMKLVCRCDGGDVCRPYYKATRIELERCKKLLELCNSGQESIHLSQEDLELLKC